MREAGGAGQGGTQVLRYCHFSDFLRHLGVDPRVDSSGVVMVAAHHMFVAPLPPHWSEQIDEASSRVYFFNPLTGESLWVHPQSELYRELIEDLRCWAPDEPLEGIFARSDAHLRQAHHRAVEAVGQWSAYDAPEGPEEAPESGDATQFFFNAATGESRWSDPRQYVEFDLRQRHSILCECIAGHTQQLSRMNAKGLSSDSSDGEDGLPEHGMQALVQNLWESLGTLPLPVRRETIPAPPESGKRPNHLPAGDDTVRSSTSYLTARSNPSSSPRADLFSGRGSEYGAASATHEQPLPNHPFLLQPPSVAPKHGPAPRTDGHV